MPNEERGGEKLYICLGKRPGGNNRNKRQQKKPRKVKE
jgi:hypothetical protein